MRVYQSKGLRNIIRNSALVDYCDEGKSPMSFVRLLVPGVVAMEPVADRVADHGVKAGLFMCWIESD